LYIILIISGVIETFHQINALKLVKMNLEILAGENKSTRTFPFQ